MYGRIRNDQYVCHGARRGGGTGKRQPRAPRSPDLQGQLRYRPGEGVAVIPTTVGREILPLSYICPRLRPDAANRACRRG
jgi:hypothetical protein